MHLIAKLDHAHVWHPFTQMREWLDHEPIVIASGQGAVLRDLKGREYLDANSSIWTNLHGHNHLKLNAAITRQLGRIAHSSALGLANEPASLLARELVDAAGPRPSSRSRAVLTKVFFSDDGSTAMEVALKLAYQFTRRSRGPGSKPRFLSLRGGYHGDTVGAVSLGHIDLFHKAYSGLVFKTDSIPAPYCYRCPFNRAKPERADAREYRRCHWECVKATEKHLSARKKRAEPYAAFVFEPLMQGAAGMIAQAPGWLHQVTSLARDHGALLIADEVLTGFGRTGTGGKPAMDEPARKTLSSSHKHQRLFACQHEDVRPDFLCLAKGLTGGYLPMAATLTTQRIFDAFLGKYEEFKTFFHGHSYTGNQLGAAAGLASLRLLQTSASARRRQNLENVLRAELHRLWASSWVGDVRQVGLMAGVELVKNWRTRQPFSLRERVGIRVCEAMARRGVLTRPIGNVVVLMPPYCTTAGQLRKMVGSLADATAEVLGR